MVRERYKISSLPATRHLKLPCHAPSKFAIKAKSGELIKSALFHESANVTTSRNLCQS